MFPLQIGDADTVFVVAIGIAFLAIVVVLILYGVRRSATITDELSKELGQGLNVIKPTTTMRKEREAKEKPQLSSRIDQKVSDLASYAALEAELGDRETELQRSLREMAALRENGNTMRKEIEDLRTEISALQERLLISREDTQEPITSMDRSVKSQVASQTRGIRTQNLQRPKTPAAQKRRGWTLGVFGDNSPPRACPTCRRRLGLKDRYCDSCGQRISP